MTDLETIATTDLAHVTGAGAGTDWGGTIGGLIDKATGGKWNAGQWGQKIGGIVDGFLGGKGGGAAPQAGQ
jgi:hypothetical protein